MRGFRLGFLWMFFSLLVGNAHGTESGILPKNLEQWKGVSLWCDMKGLPTVDNIDQAGYICGWFYGEFSEASQREGVSFAYVQTEGQHTGDKLLKMGFLPIRVEMTNAGKQSIQVKLVSDPPAQMPQHGQVFLYEQSTYLVGNPMTYGKSAIAFFKNAAEAIARDLKRYGNASLP